jgi:sRNA-binding carbon storage regulator CsrA
MYRDISGRTLMLALQLKPKEIIVIGNIKIHADKSGRSSGYLIGIEAPRDVQIHREKCEPHEVEVIQEAAKC